ncbi:MAG: hypothetical protein E4H09_03365, partial [Spirochaetales bacterium]
MTEQQKTVVVLAAVLAAILCIAAPTPAFEFRVLVTPAYEDIETGYTVTVTVRLDGGVQVYDYSTTAHRLERRYSNNSVTVLQVFAPTSVIAAPFAPFEPGIHSIPAVSHGSNPARFTTVSITDAGGDVPDPRSIGKPETFYPEIQSVAGAPG